MNLEQYDQIVIEDLEVYGYHGVFPEENEKGQPFFVNAILYTDTRKAGITDELEYSTHYGLVCNVLHDLIAGEPYKLIETVAEEAAREVLLKFPLVRAITLEVRKPEAPIGLPFRSVSVKITRGWKNCSVAFGSNMGDSKAIVEQGIAELKALQEIRVLKVSDYIKSKPYGGVEQNDFLNGALLLETLLTPPELLEKLHQIEQHAHRERILRWGPRTLDLDILIYDDVIMETEDLILPHKDMLNRDFVMKPLAQVAPGQIHPLERKTIRQLWETMKITYVYDEVTN